MGTHAQAPTPNSESAVPTHRASFDYLDSQLPSSDRVRCNVNLILKEASMRQGQMALPLLWLQTITCRSDRLQQIARQKDHPSAFDFDTSRFLDADAWHPLHTACVGSFHLL